MSAFEKIIPKYQEKAKKLLKDNDRIEGLIRNAKDRISNILSSNKSMEEFKSYILLFIEMVKSTFSGERHFSWQTIVLIVAGLIYFVTPIDLIPDFIPILGFTDDMSVILFIYKSLSGDIEAYKNRTREIS